MRLRGLEVAYWGTVSRTIAKHLDDEILRGSMVDPQIATQQGVAEDPQGAGLRFFPGVGCGCVASLCVAILMLDSDAAV